MLKVTIASGKGGTGKTTVSTNLASWISKNIEHQEVLLCDLDVEEPNSGLFLNFTSPQKTIVNKKIPEWNEAACTFCGKCHEVCKFNAITMLPKQVLVFEELCHSCYACSDLCPEDALPMVDRETGVLSDAQTELFRFVEGQLNVGEQQAAPMIKETMEYCYEKAKSEEAIILQDAPPGTSCPMIEAVKDSDLVILVAEPTRFGIHDLSLSVETMKHLKKDYIIIVNKDNPGNKEIEKFCVNTGSQIIARIPEKREIAEIYSRGELLIDHIPEVNQAMKNLHDFLKTQRSNG